MDISEKSNLPKFPRLKLPENIQVEYANIVRIAHSPSEIVFDFAHILPGNINALVQSRIIMSPLAAKLFLKAMAENLNKFEKTYGEIQIPTGGSLADQLFRSFPSTDDTSPD